MSPSASCINGEIHGMMVKIGLCITMNLLLSIGIIGLNIYLIYHLIYKKSVLADLVAIETLLTSSIKNVEFARIPPAGIAVIAEMVGGVPLNDVIQAYEKDSMERRAIVYSIMGRTKIANRFVDVFRSKFISKGYEGEEIMLATQYKTQYKV